MNSKEIRNTFLRFFESKKHTIVPSAPMVVKNDPTLMFTNAGMNQFKDIFLGNTPATSKRVADTQKCLRVSGKHNDLEEVGIDTYHHTMFEMLGNWSFGDYFKKEAIEFAWELLADVYKIPKDRMYVTVFEGYEPDGLEFDQEAYDNWKRFFPEERILKGNKKDNFWEMGEVGPCGPCSEIHVDLRDDDERKKIDGATLVNTGDPLVIEIWNLVFIQYARKANGTLEPLPQKHVDTGMGLERLCMVLQGKQSNYDTDVFQGIIGEIGELSGKKYGQNFETDVAMRVIADHLRAISFSIADGQLPSNVKAGYVIRRILRRAVRYGYTFLNFNTPFIYKLVPALVEKMGDAFPEIKQQQSLIEKVIYEEEATFLHTLETGIRLLDNVIEKAKEEGKDVIDGKSAFILYDTYGFPFDLTELILKEKNLKVDAEAFEKELEEQKNRSRSVAVIETGDWVEVKPIEKEEFLGYDTLTAEVEIARYRTINTKGKSLIQMVLNQTPFYGESGGQVGDVGVLSSETETIKVLNTVKENDLIIHVVDKVPENVYATFTARVNKEVRTSVANNHTATHLLHEALRHVLGNHVEQKGSSVSATSLRFDFSHFQKLTEEELFKVEKYVNRKVRENIPLDEHRAMPIEKAKEMGAMALFGEKYGDKVRVVRFADSVEFCGGTHVKATGQIGYFKIISEGAISAGIRRIEAITGEQAEDYISTYFDLARDLRKLFNNTPALVQAVTKAIEENAELKKRLEEFRREKISVLKQELIRSVEVVRGIKIARFDSPFSFEEIKDIVFQLKNENTHIVIVAGTITNDKPGILVALSDDLVKEGKNASTIVREAAKLIEGGGGGQPFYATAGGKKAEGLNSAVEKAIELALN